MATPAYILLRQAEHRASIQVVANYLLIINSWLFLADYRVVANEAYYQKGYQTDVSKIEIENNVIAFFKGDQQASCQYQYDGFKILTYASGKKGVRYLFSCSDAYSQAPKFIQFSDHLIGPRHSSHFHLFSGNQSHAALFTEMDN